MGWYFVLGIALALAGLGVSILLGRPFGESFGRIGALLLYAAGFVVAVEAVQTAHEIHRSGDFDSQNGETVSYQLGYGIIEILWKGGVLLALAFVVSHLERRESAV